MSAYQVMSIESCPPLERKGLHGRVYCSWCGSYKWSNLAVNSARMRWKTHQWASYRYYVLTYVAIVVEYTTWGYSLIMGNLVPPVALISFGYNHFVVVRSHLWYRMVLYGQPGSHVYSWKFITSFFALWLSRLLSVWLEYSMAYK